MPLKDDLSIGQWAKSNWRVGDDCEGISGFSRNGGVDENYMGYDRDPWDKNTLIWKCSSDGLSRDGDGGWNGSTTYPGGDIQDNLYRWSVWIKNEQPGSGLAYLGLYVVNSGGTRKLKYLNSASTTSNFYLHVQPTTNPVYFPSGEWCLFVGHCWPSGTTHGSLVKHADTGVYKMDGTEVDTYYSTKDASFNCQITGLRHRSYLYYSDPQPGVKIWWVHPRIDLCDGTEPTLQELLRHGASRVFSTNWGKFRTT